MYMYILYIMPGNHSIPFSKFMVAGSGNTAARVRLREGKKWWTDRVRIFLYMLTNFMLFHEVIFFSIVEMSIHL